VFPWKRGRHLEKSVSHDQLRGSSAAGLEDQLIIEVAARAIVYNQHRSDETRPASKRSLGQVDG
jgi:hypothetical protein